QSIHAGRAALSLCPSHCTPRYRYCVRTRRSSDLRAWKSRSRSTKDEDASMSIAIIGRKAGMTRVFTEAGESIPVTVIECTPNRRSEEHTSELQSRENLVCRLLLEKKKTTDYWSTK